MIDLDFTFRPRKWHIRQIGHKRSDWPAHMFVIYQGTTPITRMGPDGRMWWPSAADAMDAMDAICAYLRGRHA